MAEVSSGFGEVHVLDLGGKRFGLLVNDFGIVLAQILEYKVGDILNVVFPFLSAANIVNLARFEVINYVSKGAAGVFNVIKDAAVPQIDSIGLVVQGFVDKGGNDASVRAIILVRAVGIDGANPDGFGAKHGC